MKNNVELVGFVLLLIGTLGLLANEFIFNWGSYATVIFAAANVVGLAVLAYAHLGMKEER